VGNSSTFHAVTNNRVVFPVVKDSYAGGFGGTSNEGILVSYVILWVYHVAPLASLEGKPKGSPSGAAAIKDMSVTVLCNQEAILAVELGVVPFGYCSDSPSVTGTRRGNVDTRDCSTAINGCDFRRGPLSVSYDDDVGGINQGVGGSSNIHCNPCHFSIRYRSCQLDSPRPCSSISSQ